MNIPTLIPYNNIESNQRNLVSLLGATAIRPTLVQAQSRNSISLTTPGVSPKSVSNTNAIGISTALPVVTVPQSPVPSLLSPLSCMLSNYRREQDNPYKFSASGGNVSIYVP
jgi:hypothetical protein